MGNYSIPYPIKVLLRHSAKSIETQRLKNIMGYSSYRSWPAPFPALYIFDWAEELETCRRVLRLPIKTINPYLLLRKSNIQV